MLHETLLFVRGWDLHSTLKISEDSVFTILHEHLSMRKLSSKWEARLLTVDQRQQRVDDSKRCFNAIKRIFLHGMWQWMKHGSITRFQSQIDSQLSWQQRVTTFKSNQKRKCQLVRLWPPYFGMRTVFYSSITQANKIWQNSRPWNQTTLLKLTDRTQIRTE